MVVFIMRLQGVDRFDAQLGVTPGVQLGRRAIEQIPITAIIGLKPDRVSIRRELMT